jgi:TatD DNase family protein
MFDAHCHLPVLVDGVGIVNTSKRDEWQDLATLPSSFVPSVGLLPPYTDTDIASFFRFLDGHPGYAIGEVGLDRRFPDRERQEKFLGETIAYATREKRLVTLHCVREDGAMLSLLDGQTRFLWHGYTGSVESAREAVRKGVTLSLGMRVEKSRLWDRLDEIADIPFLLESDRSMDEDSQHELECFAERVAKRLSISAERLEARLDEVRRTLLEDGSSSR